MNEKEVLDFLENRANEYRDKIDELMDNEVDIGNKDLQRYSKETAELYTEISRITNLYGELRSKFFMYLAIVDRKEKFAKYGISE